MRYKPHIHCSPATLKGDSALHKVERHLSFTAEIILLEEVAVGLLVTKAMLKEFLRESQKA